MQQLRGAIRARALNSDATTATGNKKRDIVELGNNDKKQVVREGEEGHSEQGLLAAPVDHDDSEPYDCRREGRPAHGESGVFGSLPNHRYLSG